MEEEGIPEWAELHETFRASFIRHVARQVATVAIIVLVRNFNHVILPRLPTSEIILLIFRRDIIIVHYRPRRRRRQTWSLSGRKDIARDKHVSECLKIARRLPHNTHPASIKVPPRVRFNICTPSFGRCAPDRLWKSGARRAHPGKIIQKCRAIGAATVQSPPVPLIHTV